MKIIALERELPGTPDERYGPFLKAEAERVWELYLCGVIRESYYRADRHEAVLILECDSADEARAVLGTLPLVSEGLIEFELIPLVPYPGLSRLFEKA